MEGCLLLYHTSDDLGTQIVYNRINILGYFLLDISSKLMRVATLFLVLKKIVHLIIYINMGGTDIGAPTDTMNFAHDFNQKYLCSHYICQVNKTIYVCLFVLCTMIIR